MDAHQAKDRKVSATAEAPTSARAVGCIGCGVLAETLPLGGSASVEFTGFELDAVKPRSGYERLSPRAQWPALAGHRCGTRRGPTARVAALFGCKFTDRCRGG